MIVQSISYNICMELMMNVCGYMESELEILSLEYMLMHLIDCMRIYYATEAHVYLSVMLDVQYSILAIRSAFIANLQQILK